MKLLSFSGAILTVLLMSTHSCEDPLFDGKSCTGNCIVIQGKVTDSVSGTGIPDVGLKFYYSEHTIIGMTSRLLVETYTKQNGEYNITFDGTNYKDAKGDFSLRSKHISYFIDPLDDYTPGGYLNPKNINFNQPVLINFSMFLPAYIRLRLKAGGATAVKSLSFSAQYGKFGTLGSWISIRPNLDTTIVYKTAADIQTNIRWNTYPITMGVEKKDSLRVGKRDTMDYKIDL